MNILDDLTKMKKLDPGQSLESIQAFPNQLEDVWHQAQKANFPNHLKKAKNIIVAGMGGSALGGRIVKNLFTEQLKVPFVIVTEYQLPRFASPETLVIIASYSGNTKETLTCLKNAQKAKAKLLGFTTGGKVGEAIKNGLPGFIFQPQYNYLGYSKTAIGYSLGALMAILAKMKFIQLGKQQLFQSLTEFKEIQKKFLMTTPFSQNPAKKLAQYFQGKIGVWVSSEHLKGATWAARNEINEIAHSLALFFDLPEMNHHLVEAFSNPVQANSLLAYLFISSENYFSRLKAHYQVTSQILKKIKANIQIYQPEGRTKLSQVFEIVQLGGFVSVYLSFLNNQDPGPEPWILYLKKQLSAHGKK